MPSPLDVVAFAVCFAAVVVAPLGLGVVLPDARDGKSAARRRLRFLLVGAGLGLPFAFADRGGDFGKGASLWWVFVTGVTAIVVLRRAVSASRLRLGELVAVLGYLELPVGAVWLRTYLSDQALAGYSGLSALLTAVHFHFAGMGLAVLVGALSRTIDAAGPLRRLFQAAALGVALSVPLLALGIAFDRRLELVAGAVVAASTAIVGLFALLHARRARRVAVLAMLGFAGAAALSAAALAAWFLSRGFAELDADRLRFMVSTHGALNAFGVVGLGVLALAWEPPTPRRSRAGLPVSTLRAGAFVGPDFFEREDAVDPVGEAHGLTDRFDDFGVDVHPDVTRFYEHTDEHELHVVPSWRGPFRLGGAIFCFFAGLVGQLSLPRREDVPERMKSRLVPLREIHDGRPAVRGWVRTRTDDEGDEEAVYVAAYAAHQELGVRYMNIAFPLPFSTMTSILRLTRSGDAGLSLTTLHEGDGPDGDQGVYLTTWVGVLRLPLDETIEVFPADGEVPPKGVPGSVVLRARHRMWVFGIRYLTLDYWISRTKAAEGADSPFPKPTEP